MIFIVQKGVLICLYDIHFICPMIICTIVTHTYICPILGTLPIFRIVPYWEQYELFHFPRRRVDGNSNAESYSFINHVVNRLITT